MQVSPTSSIAFHEEEHENATPHETNATAAKQEPAVVAPDTEADSTVVFENEANTPHDAHEDAHEIEFQSERSSPTQHSIQYDVAESHRTENVGLSSRQTPAQLSITPRATRNEMQTTYPPPSRLSRRAAQAAKTPRANGAVPPATPRSRSPTSNYVSARAAPPPQEKKESAITSPSSGHSEQHPHHTPPTPTPPPAGIPPLVPGEVRPLDTATAPPQSHARDGSQRSVGGGSDFSSIADLDVNASAAPAASAMPPVTVSTHQCHLPGTQWDPVLQHSYDAVERTVVKETAMATGLDPQFIRITDATVSANGMTCHLSIGHDPAVTPKTIDDAIAACKYEHTMQLHALKTARGEHQRYGIGALLESNAATAPPPHDSSADSSEIGDAAAAPQQHNHHLVYSFTKRVGDGFLLVDYTAEPHAPAKHMELYFNSTPAAISVAYVKQCVSEYAGVAAANLIVSSAGQVVGDEAKGRDLEWINGSVVDVTNATAVASGADANGVAVTPHTAKRSPKKHKKKGGKKRKTVKGNSKAAKQAPPGSRSPSPPKHRSGQRSPSASRDHDSPLISQRISRKNISKTFTTPRYYILRTPRQGAEYAADGSSVAHDLALYGAAPESISYTTPSISPGLGSRQRSVQSASISRTIDTAAHHHHQRQGSISQNLPAQHVIRGVVSTTPLPHRPPVANGEKKTRAGSSHPSAHRMTWTAVSGVERQGDTPSVSRRSHSPHQPPLSTSAYNSGDDLEEEHKLMMAKGSAVVISASSAKEDPLTVAGEKDILLTAEQLNEEFHHQSAPRDGKTPSTVHMLLGSSSDYSEADGADVTEKEGGEAASPGMEEDDDEPVPAAAPNPFV